MDKINKLAQFREAAKPEEWEDLAAYAGTSTEYLRHLAKGYGKRTPNVDMAVKIEEFTTRLAKSNPDLPIVTCEDLAAIST